MPENFSDLYNSNAEPRRRPGPLRQAGGLLLLALGAVFGRISTIFLGGAQRLTDQATIREWNKAISYVLGATPGQRQPSSKQERLFIRYGTSVISSIISVLIVMWTLLLLGGALVWLALHGFGFFILLGAVLLGTLIGLHLAQLGRHGTDRERLN
jgi:hypothetical protein